MHARLHYARTHAAPYPKLNLPYSQKNGTTRSTAPTQSVFARTTIPVLCLASNAPAIFERTTPITNNDPPQVYNPGVQAIDGTFSTEDVEKTLRGGMYQGLQPGSIVEGGSDGKPRGPGHVLGGSGTTAAAPAADEASGTTRAGSATDSQEGLRRRREAAAAAAERRATAARKSPDAT